MKKTFLALTFLSTIGFSQQLTTNSGAPVGDNQNSKTIGNKIRS